MFANNLPEAPALLDENGDPTPFANIGLRMFGHDILDGRVDGDVAMRALLNPEGTDNADFRQNIELLKKWGELDLNDDNRINGSVYRDLAEQYWQNAGGEGSAPLSAFPDFEAVQDDRFWRTDVPATFDFASGSVNREAFANLASNYGLSEVELTDVVLWGHLLSRLPAEPAARDAGFDRCFKW